MPDSYTTAILIAVVFIVAGLVKGITGMGLPTVAIGLLGLMMAPREAAALLIIPSLVTNLWQFLTGPHVRHLLRRFWTLLLTIGIATFLFSTLLVGGKSGYASAALGLALISYAALGLSKTRFTTPQKHERWLSPIVGAVTGLITGATGVFVIPAVPYLQSLGLEKEDLVQALGLSFTASTIALALGLASHNALPTMSIGHSLLCIAPALVGMSLGQIIRKKVNASTFQLIFFIGMLILGGELLLRSLR